MKRMSKSKAGIVQITIRKPVAGCATDSELFTTWDVLERAGWRPADASRALQMAASSHFGFRPFAQEFEVIAEVQIGRTVARANPEHGSGRAEKLFIAGAQQARALAPVGELIVLAADDTDPPKAEGFIAELIEHELALGNQLVGADQRGMRGQSRFWRQDPLHRSEVETVVAAQQRVTTREGTREDLREPAASGSGRRAHAASASARCVRVL
ncbi:MAG: hypothetical protein QM756_29420 [Polyangiaceae bacterium]